MQAPTQTNSPDPAPGGPARQTAPRPPNALPVFPEEFQADRYLKMDEAELLAILKDPAASVFQVNVACRRLALIGTRQAVPVLGALLSNEQLAHYARYALKPIPDPAVDEALRASLPRLKGKLLAGVIDTIGHRQDTKAVEPLVKLLSAVDLEVAQAAAASLGQIGGPVAARALLDGLGKTKGVVRNALADAGLVCAEGFLDRGEPRQALALYDALSRPEMPKEVRLGAMHSMIVMEKSHLLAPPQQ